MINEVLNVSGALTSAQLSSENNKNTLQGTPFSEFLGVAIDNISKVNDTVKIADKMAVDFAVGKIDNPQTLMIAQEKASLAVSYATKITNKILEVYQEIMRMQV